MRYLNFLIILTIIISADSLCFGNGAALQQAWEYYLEEDYDKALDACRKISRSEMLGEEGHYIMGLSFLKQGSYDKARRKFEFALESYPRAKRKQALLLGMADSYYLEENFEEAETHYLGLLKSFPDTDYASIAYLRLGECRRKQGKWQESESSFYKVGRDFPLSLEAKPANDYLKEKRAYFSIQVGAFSSKENARKLSSHLNSKGYGAYVEKIYQNDKLIYRVRVGKFSTRRQAQDEAARLEGQGFSVRICT